MMDSVVVEVVAKERINSYLMEAEIRWTLRLAGVANRWGRLVAHMSSAKAVQNQQLPIRCCSSERLRRVANLDAMPFLQDISP